MKRFRSSEDLDHYGNDKDKLPSHRPFYSPNKSSDPPPPRGKSLHSSSYSSRFDRDPPDPSRLSRKRPDHDLDRLLRRKGSSGPPPDRYSDRKPHGPDSLDRDGGHPSSRLLAHRSDGFSIPKREFPKGVRSDRDRSRREGNSSSSSWHRIGNVSKDLDEARGGRSGLERERKALKDVRSPTWSKDSGSDQSKRAFLDVSWKVRGKDKEKSPGLSRGDSGSEQQSKMSSPVLNPSDVKVQEKKDDAKEKSPSWSSEQSRSIAAKRSAERRVESGSSSEMEEGQLEPEVAGKPGLDSDVTTDNGTEHGPMELADHTELLTKREERMDVGDEAAEDSRGKEVCMTDIVEESGEKKDEVIPEELKNSVDGGSGSLRDESETESDSVTAKHGNLSKGSEVESSGTHFVRMKGTDTDALCGKLSSNEEAVGLDTFVGIELPEEGAEAQELHLGNLEDSRLLKHQSGLSGERPRPVTEDRGKSVSFVPINAADAGDGSVCVGKDSGGAVASENLDEEGPSTRGFELFSRSPVRKPEKIDHSGVIERKDDKMEMEPLDLSLSLPNVLLPIGARDAAAAPASPSQGRSIQSWSSFRTNSEGFTASISYSGSQSFFHNPSCSLTQNSLDFEQSVKSRPLFQGVDWQALAQSESKHNEPTFQGTVSNGNGYLHHLSQAPKGNSNGQLLHGLNLRVLDGSSGTPSGLDRQLSLHRQVPDGRTKLHDDEGKSPSQSVGSHEMGAMQRFDRKRGTSSNCSGSLYRSSSQKACEHMLNGSEFVESVIEKIVSEPPGETAGKFHEMQGEVLTHLKESVYEIMVSTDKRRRLLVFQEALQERPDITMEMLLKSHRSQLEIMVALKTGQTDFLHQQTNLSTSDLAEIFLNLRCRNLACRSPLPVNECDCKVCARKNGFCSECMCLLCFKFDMASNTCSWVGCDLCLHWCHADCAIRESYIRNGPSVSGTPVASEVQFYCVACDHPSEMFGFVKDVFQNFAKEWSAENFRRELEYVRRIFLSSKDLRGRWLYGVADQMLGRLADKANLPEVYNHVITLLKETDPTKFVEESDARMDSRKEKNAVAGPSQDVSWVKAIIADKNSQGEHVAIDIPSNNVVRNERIILDTETLRSDREEPLFDELESIVRIKHAEAKMFQARADDARRDAEGLRRIAVAKNEKTEEEFRARIAKLRMTEAEEVRKQKSEELQALERSHREYLNMKIRMEADIKDLLLKMEATKRNMAL